ncbi:MAG: hypothetical protein ACYTEQ_05455 [Planctomycetota bacterium]|jgi:hypothetical protein
MGKVTMAFSLDSETDEDILSFFASLPKRTKSRTFRAMARAHIGGVGLTLGNLYQEIVEVKRLLQSGVIVQGRQTAGDEGDDPARDDPLVAEAEAQLANLGL